MSMLKIAINQLSEPVREFLARVRVGQGIVIEDEARRARYSVVEHIEASQEEPERAWQEIQQKTKQVIEEQGGSVEEVERLILADED